MDSLKYSEPGSSGTAQNEDEIDLMKRRRIVRDSNLSAEVEPYQCPIVYSNKYNISFWKLEKLHPFDSQKWGHIYDMLVESGRLTPDAVIEPREATKDDLRIVHTAGYLCSLNCSMAVAAIVEVPIVAFIPHCLVESKLLRPMRLQTGGTVIAARLALQQGWSINIGGGFHHARSNCGGGFSVYADINLALTFLFLEGKIEKAMIVDLDAHQGNGHERDFTGDARVYIFDMYNSDIYPHDSKAKKGIRREIKLVSGTRDSEYLDLLAEGLNAALDEFVPDILVYNAGTDSLIGDPLGLLRITPEGIIRRDEIVFTFAHQSSIPIVMVTSGGYLKKSAKVIADSILNLDAKELIKLC
ncbi:histone deacetylase domain-containing protein [Ditylenchus destructor]|nr:histone deacetylase domain-containing protein [Ditylenchus destructor]